MAAAPCAANDKLSCRAELDYTILTSTMTDRCSLPLRGQLQRHVRLLMVRNTFQILRSIYLAYIFGASGIRVGLISGLCLHPR